MLALTLSACGGDGDDNVTPVLDQIAPAVAAIEAELGGPQQYFEINATPQLVNLFVAIDGATQRGSLRVRRWRVGARRPIRPAPKVRRSAASRCRSTPTPCSMPSGPSSRTPMSSCFSIAGDPVQYRASVQSGDGGSLDVVARRRRSIQSVTRSG